MTKRGYIAIQNTETGRVEVPGRIFSHYIDNVQVWFTWHKPRGCDAIVSHKDSGMRFTYVEPYRVCAALGDDIAAARSAIDAKVKQHGAPRIRSVLAGAPALPEYRPAPVVFPDPQA